ncbi:MAG: phosphoserine phosphatase SerB, partial [Pseudomonadota bacterium]
DINILSTEGRKKRLLIADMDSTIINQECIDELAEFAGKRLEIEAITERAMRGELDFESALKERVGMLRGLSENTLAETFEKRITITSGAETLIRTMKAQGATTALVSGGFTYFAGRVAAAVGFDRHRANRLIIEDAKLTGTVEEPILGRDAKLAALKEFCAANDVAPNDALAVGDGANDLAMLGAAGLGVAFHAKPAVAAAAHAHVDHGDLTALLYLQGIPASEFAQ